MSVGFLKMISGVANLIKRAADIDGSVLWGQQLSASFQIITAWFLQSSCQTKTDFMG